MALSPQHKRRTAFILVVLGFVAELTGVGMLSAGQRTPLALGVMIVGLVLVIAGMTMIAAARGE